MNYYEFLDRVAEDPHPCKHGHLICSDRPGGRCSDELRADLNLDEYGDPIPKPISKTTEAAKFNAGTVLVAYSPGASAREALIDFLTDSLHLFGEEQVRFALDSALIHHQAEQSEVLAS